MIDMLRKLIPIVICKSIKVPPKLLVKTVSAKYIILRRKLQAFIAVITISLTF